MTISRIVFALVGMAGLAAAQSTITVSVSGVGDCSAVNWTFDASETPSSAGQIPKGQISALVVNRLLDKCSPLLFELVPEGRVVPSVVVTQYDSSATGRIPVLTVTLENVRVSNYQVGGSTASPLPSESVAFTFERIKLEYKTQNSSTGVITTTGEAGWDFTTNSRS